MSSILSRTYGGVPDNKAIIENSSICRPFLLGDWNTIRFCTRLSINASATIAASPHYAVGLCSGATVFNGATTQFVGIIGNVVTGITMPYNAGPPRYFHTRHYLGTKVGATIVGSTGNYNDANNSQPPNSTMSVYENTGVPMRDLMFVQIKRPGGATTPTVGQYDVSIFVRTSNTVFVDVSAAQFLAQSVAAIPVIASSHTNYGNDFTPFGIGTGKLAVDELTYGPLDHVMVGWDQTGTSIEVSDIGIVRII